MLVKRRGVGRLAIVIALALSAGSVLAHGNGHKGERTGKPLVIAKQGSFFVNEKSIVSAFPSGTGNPTPSQITVDQMYVEYQIPDKREFPYPIIMVHGSGHTGKTYDETPDGRDGWQTYFPRQGWSTYVVDHAGRARSGFDPTPSNQAKLQSNPTLIPSFSKFTDEGAWTVFRIGTTPFTPHPSTQFPVSAFKEYSAQIVPNTETSLEPGCASGGAGCTHTINALVALLDKIGPAIVMVHSQSGRYGLAVATARPNLVKAVVSVEPTSCAVTDPDLPTFRRVPLLTVFGDFIEGTFWANTMASCVETVNRVKATGGVADNLHLPAAGFIGNSHMLMLDKNNIKIADHITRWLEKKVDKGRWR